MRSIPNSSVRDDHSGEPARRFKVLSEEYAKMAGKAGVSCIPYEDPELPHFSRVPKLKQANAIQFLENALAVFGETLVNGGSLRDDRALMWRMVNRMGLVPESGIFDKIGSEDIVEIYSLPDHTHLAWNLNMYKFSTYTAEQLLCIPWWEATSRSPEALEEFGQIARGLASNEITSTVTPKCGWHSMEEKNTRDLLILKLKVKYVSPLRKDGRNAGFMAINGAKVIGSNRR